MPTPVLPQLTPTWANAVECAIRRSHEHHADRGRYWREQEAAARLMGIPEAARLCQEAAAALQNGITSSGSAP